MWPPQTVRLNFKTMLKPCFLRVWRNLKACSEYVGSCLEMMRYAEVNAIISKVQDVAWKTYAWSRAMLIEVPENMANSDHPWEKEAACQKRIWITTHCKRCYRCLTVFRMVWYDGCSPYPACKHKLFPGNDSYVQREQMNKRIIWRCIILYLTFRGRAITATSTARCCTTAVRRCCGGISAGSWRKRNGEAHFGMSRRWEMLFFAYEIPL